MRTACVMQASPVMHTFGACAERIASPITAQLHRLSLICVQLKIHNSVVYSIELTSDVGAISLPPLTKNGAIKTGGKLPPLQ